MDNFIHGAEFGGGFILVVFLFVKSNDFLNHHITWKP
jgi:hypothetical protein